MIFEVIVSLITLILLEAILGIDNLIFISILSSRLPEVQQKKARRLGLMLAWVIRLLLLLAVVWIIKLTYPLFTLFKITFSWHDLFLIAGGLFLLVKGTHEIHTEFERVAQPSKVKSYANFYLVILQIGLFDIIFSLDSILTAIGLTKQYWVMATAITIAIVLMLLASEPLTRFIHKHPTIKMLALSFLLLIGVVLIADGFHAVIPRGYIYFAVCFSLLVEMLNHFISRKKNKKLM